MTEGARRERHENLSMVSIVDSLLSTLHASANRISALRGQRIFHWLWLCGQSLFFFSGCRPRFSRLAASPLDALSRAWLTEKKKETARSLPVHKILVDNRCMGILILCANIINHKVIIILISYRLNTSRINRTPSITYPMLLNTLLNALQHKKHKFTMAHLYAVSDSLFF